jgi:hypothetical protein
MTSGVNGGGKAPFQVVKTTCLGGSSNTTVVNSYRYTLGAGQGDVTTSVAEPEPPETYNFDPRRTGTVSLL